MALFTIGGSIVSLAVDFAGVLSEFDILLRPQTLLTPITFENEGVKMLMRQFTQLVASRRKQREL